MEELLIHGGGDGDCHFWAVPHGDDSVVWTVMELVTNTLFHPSRVEF